MPSHIAQLIRQGKPFENAEQEVYLALLRLSSELTGQFAELFRDAGLSSAQYNVLRILRGAGDAALTCGEIGDRLVTRDPDVTRLLDRLERQGHVARSREREDRRVVTTRITAAGLDVLASLDAPVAELHRRQLGHLGAERLRALLDLLAAAAEATAVAAPAVAAP
ncbi:MAG: MarR family transcriptional regulator [Gemmatirosa sp.]|nr:MarR family transcriptional regulator [Gemmatirosa sp.]